MSSSASSSVKKVLVVGTDGHLCQQTLSSLLSQKTTNNNTEKNSGGRLHVVAGVADPASFEEDLKRNDKVSRDVKVIQVDIWDKAALTATLKHGKYDRLFITASTAAMDATTATTDAHAPDASSATVFDKREWKNGLEAAKEAGVLQVILVNFVKPTEDNQEVAGEEDFLSTRIGTGEDEDVPAVISVQREFMGLPRESSWTSVNSNASSSSTTATPSLVTGGGTTASALASSSSSQHHQCIRVQRKTILREWSPMKIMLLQITLPNSLSPEEKRRCVSSSVSSENNNSALRVPSPSSPTTSTFSSAAFKNYTEGILHQLHVRKQALLAPSQSQLDRASFSSSLSSSSGVTPSSLAMSLMERSQQQPSSSLRSSFSSTTSSISGGGGDMFWASLLSPQRAPQQQPRMTYEEMLESLQLHRLQLLLEVDRMNRNNQQRLQQQRWI